MQRRSLIQSAGRMLAAHGAAWAQPAMKRVGWLGWRADTSPTPAIPLQAFRAGLADLGWSEFALAGNLMRYGPNLSDTYRQLARYADKILRGAKPAELPVEQPTRLALTLNMNAASAIGLKLPRALMLRADEVIR